MALPTITTSDFKGYWNISQNDFKTEDLQYYIDLYYPKFVREVLGDETYLDIKGNDKAKWNELFAETPYLNKDCNKTLINDGLKIVCVGIVYFYFVRENGVISTPTGKAQNVNGNAEHISHFNFAVTRHNLAIDTLKNSVYTFIDNYKTIEVVASGSVDLGSGNYTIQVDSTKYLYVDDVVTVDNQEYTVTSIDDDVSFNIEGAASGLDFSGKKFIYEPFGIVEMKNKKPLFI